MADMMLSSSEKDPDDPIMLGVFARTRALRSGVLDKTHCKTIDLKPGPKDKFLTKYADRFPWPAYGWSQLWPTMRYRLIRNVKRAIAMDEMSGMV